jgi:hypothetical protein
LWSPLDHEDLGSPRDSKLPSSFVAEEARRWFLDHPDA